MKGSRPLLDFVGGLNPRFLQRALQRLGTPAKDIPHPGEDVADNVDPLHRLGADNVQVSRDLSAFNGLGRGGDHGASFGRFLALHARRLTGHATAEAIDNAFLQASVNEITGV
ncbi:hypothetical protein D3C85_1488020 [compost metagenome]